jgi:3-phosphoshikimate 1-carboxyvinyltransferase
MTSHATSTMTPLTARRAGALRGRMRVPGDKSISHRALILGALAVGTTRISGLLEGEDVLNTANAMRALGVRVERTGEGAWQIDGVGVAGFAEPRAPLDFGNSGTGCRLVMGAVAGCPISATFDGDASLRRRPMGRILEPVALMGARVTLGGEGGKLPLTLAGARDPIPIVYRTPVASAQIKSAVLLAGLAAPGTTTVIEAEASRDHTELMLAHFGAEVKSEPHGPHGRKISLTGQPELAPAAIAVPADPSSAAFPMVAALIVPGSDIFLPDVMTNPLRTGLFVTLRAMGAAIMEEERRDGGEAMAGYRVRASELRGVEVPAERAPSMIDEYPILAVAAGFAQGTTVMRGLKELRVKESDRLAATAYMLRRNGIAAEILGDDLVVHGGGPACAGGGVGGAAASATGGGRGGGAVATHMDHRIAMAALVLGLAAEKPVMIDDAAMIATSFPGFVERMRELGSDLRA